MEFNLLIKKIKGRLTEDEEELFDNWIAESENHQNFFDHVKFKYGRSDFKINKDQGWKVVSSKLGKPKHEYSSIWKYGIAASLIVFLFYNFFFESKISPVLNSNRTEIVQENNILPGEDRAILTLGDGNEVLLVKNQNFSNKNMYSDGEQLVYQSDSLSQSYSEHYLSVPRGGQFRIELADGTIVWLNSDSKIKYPNHFIPGKKRIVELIYGEAYFDVSPSSQHDGSRFIVLSKMQKVEVVGTEFNIKAYEEENTYTTLVEGIVEVHSNDLKETLKPSERSIISSKGNSIYIEKIDIYNETSWKEGVFSFKQKKLKEIMKVLSRWYDMKVVFENKDLENIGFNGVLGKDQDIEQILETIKGFDIIKDYQIDDKTIILK